MRRKKHKQDAKETAFKRIFGVKPKTFEKMQEILQKEYTRLHKQGGCPPKVSVQQKLEITLKYLREYRTMESIGHDYGVSRSTVCETIQWVENTLRKNKAFALPGKNILKKAGNQIERIVIDVTESPVCRPKKTKNSTIPGKGSAIQ